MGKDLSKNIVIVSEFTVNGSRGGSPGRYVLRYMARKDATETLTPAPVRPEEFDRLQRQIMRAGRQSAGAAGGRNPERQEQMWDYVTRYMARDSATEAAPVEDRNGTRDLMREFGSLQGYSGRAFGPDSLSLSHREVLDAADRIQREYEKGKPVLKTVISFDTDYLKASGVLPADLEVKKRGDLYGKSDQAKLRLAIQQGLKTISGEYSHLDYIGVIQSDATHLHCHLAMVDLGPGKHFAPNGEQRGMITAPMKSSIRRGIDNSLDLSKQMKPLNIQMEGERRNTLSFIRRFTSRVIEERGLPQYLMACLPKEDKSLWKASINADGGPDGEMEITRRGRKTTVRGNMKKANTIVRNYVTDLLNRPESGWEDTFRARHIQLEARRERGDFDDYWVYRTTGRGKKKKSRRVHLTPEEAVRDQEQHFRDEVVERGMNAVYDVLKEVDDSTVSLHTPMMDVMSMPYEEMASRIQDDQLAEFGFRLRSCSSRLDWHRECYQRVNEAVHQYEDGRRELYDPASRPVYDLLKTEQEYNHGLMCKYQTFLHFWQPRDDLHDDLEEVLTLHRKVQSRKAMREDRQLRDMNDEEEMERAGEEIYGLSGASMLRRNRMLFDQQAAEESRLYQQNLRNFREKLALRALLFDEDGETISPGLAYDFDQVKAWDLHHMGYDFTYDFPIAMENIRSFINMSDRRWNAWQKAEDYLERSGQAGGLDGVVSGADIEAAHELAELYRGSDRMYHTKFDNGAQLRRNSATIRLDHDLYDSFSDRRVMESLKEIMEDLDRGEDQGRGREKFEEG